MNKDARIYVAGGDTLLGAALLRQLATQGYTAVSGGCGEIVDDGNPKEVEAFFRSFRPEYLFHAAGLSGGIAYNQKHPATLAMHNLQATQTLVQLACRHRVKRLLYFASSCCYPRGAHQPMHPGLLWTGPLECTSEAYAMAKLSGIALCRAFRAEHGLDCVTCIPTNLYGPGDTCDANCAHVLMALLVRLHQAAQTGQTEVQIWGTGRARREFLYVDDAARAALCVAAAERPPEIINLAGGEIVSIAQLAHKLADAAGYEGQLRFDATRPDGAPEKALCPEAILQLGWLPEVELAAGIEATWAWYRETQSALELSHVD